MAKVLCVLYDDPVGGYPTSYAIGDIPKLDRYPGGQTMPTPKQIDFKPGQLLGRAQPRSGSRISLWRPPGGWPTRDGWKKPLLFVKPICGRAALRPKPIICSAWCAMPLVTRARSIIIERRSIWSPIITKHCCKWRCYRRRTAILRGRACSKAAPNASKPKAD